MYFSPQHCSNTIECTSKKTDQPRDSRVKSLQELVSLKASCTMDNVSDPDCSTDKESTMDIDKTEVIAHEVNLDTLASGTKKVPQILLGDEREVLTYRLMNNLAMKLQLLRLMSVA